MGEEERGKGRGFGEVREEAPCMYMVKTEALFIGRRGGGESPAGFYCRRERPREFPPLLLRARLVYRAAGVRAGEGEYCGAGGGGGGLHSVFLAIDRERGKKEEGESKRQLKRRGKQGEDGEWEGTFGLAYEREGGRGRGDRDSEHGKGEGRGRGRGKGSVSAGTDLFTWFAYHLIMTHPGQPRS